MMIIWSFPEKKEKRISITFHHFFQKEKSLFQIYISYFTMKYILNKKCFNILTYFFHCYISNIYFTATIEYPLSLFLSLKKKNIVFNVWKRRKIQHIISTWWWHWVDDDNHHQRHYIAESVCSFMDLYSWCLGCLKKKSLKSK